MEHMKYFLLLVTCLNVSVVFGHGGSHVEEGVWHNKTLTVKWDSNWPTEHCIDVLKPLTLKYKWSTEHVMKYDFHVHPNNEKNEYQTEYFSKSDSIKTESGEVITNKPGTYCFNFDPVSRLNSNGEIDLSYRLD